MQPASVLDVIADGTRRHLLAQLASGPASVRAISDKLGVTVSAVSQHLKVLREAGLVTYASVGRRRIYRLATDALDRVQAAAAQVLRPRSPPVRAEGADPLEMLARQRARTWPQLDALTLLISFRVERVVRAIHRDSQRIASRAGLTLGEMLTLGAIAALGPPYETGPTELKQALWISLPGVAKRLDLLESRGLIARLPNPEDRRAQVIRLTGQGLAALKATRVGTANPSYMALDEIPRSDRIELERLLRMWQQTMEKREVA